MDLLDEAGGSPSLVEPVRAAVGRLGGIDVRIEEQLARMAIVDDLRALATRSV